MFCLYDRNGILRFVNSDREACLDYAELFELKSADLCFLNTLDSADISNDINQYLNQVENNN